ncbi:zinc ABC transporter substrate-binding protein [Candidatus Saccharibacteria bacterium]|nr:zinc ABC transporter substrate-binding protein [Candidatus Saccharibacteria bacterium]
MKNRLLKIISGILAITLIVGICIFAIIKLSQSRKTANIISSNFVGYDFARAVTGDKSEVSMLLKPGTEMHNYEPTPEDIVNIKNADLFIYIGGESDEWVEDLLKDNEIPEEKTLRLMSLVEVVEEELSDGMETHESDGNHEGRDNHHHDEEKVEYDEHIWTSPVNAIKLVNGVRDKLSKIHPENEVIYTKNANTYASRLSDINQKIRDVVATSNKKELIFGDRFPFRYFVDEYGLDYYAAFPGCSEQTEASNKTIAFLINQAKADDIKTILKIELTSDKLAKSIADEAGAKVMTLNAAHNISSEDFEKGVTYADIMESNISIIKEALK